MMSHGNSLKRIFSILVALVIVMGIVFAAAYFDTNLGHHPLNQISDNADYSSVDSDSNNNIDWADNAVHSMDCQKDALCEMNAAYVYGNMSVQDSISIGQNTAPAGV